jgi:DNA polymerase I
MVGGFGLSLVTEDTDAKEARRARMKEAQERAEIAAESIADAWARIFQSKLTDADRVKLEEVKKAMEAGEIDRLDSDRFYKTGKPKKFTKAEALRMWKRLQEEKRDERLAEMVEKTPENYHLIRTPEAFQTLLEDLRKEDMIAVDTETNGVDTYRDELVGISLTLPKADYHVYIPFGHVYETEEGEWVRVPGQLDIGTVLRGLRPILENDKIGKVLHNTNFDAHMFASYGIRLRGLRWDTMIAMALLNENEPSKRLKDLATKYLREPSDTFDTLFGKAKFSTVPLDVALVYAAKDTDLTWRLYQFQRHHMEKRPKLLKMYEKVENPLIDVVIDMEREGFRLDTKYARTLGQELENEIERIMVDLRKHFGDINFNSPVQLSALFFDELGLDKYLPPNAERKTDVATLKILAPHHPGIKALLEYREKNKLLTTYVRALPEEIKPDGLLHGSFLQASTVTGRFSSKDPNLQNQPGYVRKLFLAPEGRLLLTADLSQQEPRLLAHFSGEPLLIEAYHAGKDLYTTAAAELFGLPESECGDGSKYRKMLKTGLLACMYGTGPKTLAGQLGISEKEAEDFLRQFFAKYKKVDQWIKYNQKFAEKYGYVEMLGGRKRRLPEAKSKDRWKKFRALRQATNARIQGSAAVQTKVIMLKLADYCRRKEGFSLALTVHDEVGLYVPKSITPAEVREIEEIMLTAVPLRVPSATDIEIQERWSVSVNFDKEAGLWTKVLEDDKKQKHTIGHHASATDALAAFYALQKQLKGEVA